MLINYKVLRKLKESKQPSPKDVIIVMLKINNLPNININLGANWGKQPDVLTGFCSFSSVVIILSGYWELNITTSVKRS